MNRVEDTHPRVAEMVAERYRSMTPAERLLAASSMYESARALIEASLPAGQTRFERRLAVATRLYGAELPEAALHAHARFGDLPP